VELVLNRRSSITAGSMRYIVGAFPTAVRHRSSSGTRFTMQSAFYSDALSDHQIGMVVPNEDEQLYIHGKYMNELVKGIILPETRERLITIIKTLKERAQIDGVILGGTELSLILRDDTVFGVQVLDTTQIHVEAAVAQLLSGRSASHE
jgi:aspartate racemase